MADEVPERERVPRYDATERINHWIVALLFLLSFASGLALFEPAFAWLSFLFGGGGAMRILHPYLGAGMALLFAPYAAKVWRENFLLPSDRVWLKKARAIATQKEHVPVEGKYNAGQKLLFWYMLTVIVGLLASGIFIWRPWFAHLFSSPVRRIAVLAHALCGFLMFVGIGIHIYAAIWTRGSIHGMVRGWVSRRWARFHHPGWLREVEASEAKPAAEKGRT
jgi:formate dehydrogenase subunit gamma